MQIGNSENLSYDLSSVNLKNGRVAGYANLSGNLRVVAKTNSSRANTTYFSIGSTRDEVIAAQGTPSGVMQIGDSENLSYDLSSVNLKNGRVTGYSNLSDNLKIK